METVMTPTATDPFDILLQRHLIDWQTQLQTWAHTGALLPAAQKALHLTEVPRPLQDLNSRLAARDWSDIPKVEILCGSGMGGAIGAWSSSTQTIFLNSNWVSRASRDQILSVLSEEFGHFLDSLLNPKDTKGDEGEIFSRILTAGTIPRRIYNALTSENDEVTLKLKDGSQAKAEAATRVGGEGSDRIIGTSSNDVLLGRAGDDRIEGLSGHDFLEGGTGNNEIFGGTGDDYITQGIDTQAGTSYTISTIKETPDSLLIDAGDGDDVVIIYGGTNSRSRISGGNGIDMISIQGSRYDDISGISGIELWNLGGNETSFFDYSQSKRFEFESAFKEGSYASASRLLSRNLGNRARSDFPTTEGYTVNFWGGSSGKKISFSNSNTLDVLGKLQIAFAPTWSFKTIDASAVTQGHGFIFINDASNGSSNNRAHGSSLDDEYYGIRNFSDVFMGGPGNDYYDGGDGDDIAIFSGKESDYTVTEIVYNTFQVRDKRTGSPDGTDTIVDVNQLRFADGESAIAIRGLEIIGDETNENISGGKFSDFIDGADGNDVLRGLNGNDIVIGGAGDDLIIGGSGKGNDQYQGGTGTDTVRYSSALAAITVNLATGSSFSTAGGDLASIGRDTLSTIENVIAGSFNDTLIGDSQNNRLDGWLGADTMRGGLGNDTYIVDNTDDRVIEEADAGTDTVRASVGHTLKANVENLILTGSNAVNGIGNALNNVLTGNAESNVLNGGAGDDSMNGGGDDDVLVGGTGRDNLTGSTGVDRFIYRSIAESGVGSDARDVITDFRGTSGEKIDLSNIDAYTKMPGNQAFTFIGSDAFTGTRGEARFSRGILQMNIDNDKIADMEIALTGISALQSSFLVL